MKKILSFFVITLCFLFLQKNVNASDALTCPNRYVTLVNPVRGRNLWSDKTLNPLLTQYAASSKYKMPATWLFQYDSLTDGDVIKAYQKFEIKGEAGVFLEVSKKLADQAGVEYPENVKWSNPRAVFLSAFKRSDRRKLIDALYVAYKDEFGFYPHSVGAWWIDSFSINYIKSKYGLFSILIVADQKITDSYGVWGQWWGYPYIPSKYNLLTPAKFGTGPVVIQWAQRDPTLAYGEGPESSNFSVQANDYIRNGKDTKYFDSLVATYMDCRNLVGQLTIGMETGMEALDFAGEYDNQLKLLSGKQNLNFVTMSAFSRHYLRTYRGNPDSVQIGDFILTKDSRENRSLGDYINYSHIPVFADYFTQDTANFLDRRLDGLKTGKRGVPYVLLVLIFLATLFYSVSNKKFFIFFITTLFLVTSYGLIFRSGFYMDWGVYYTFIQKNIYTVQIITFLLSLAVFKLLSGKIKNVPHKNFFLLLIPLSYGFDGLVSLFRYSVINGEKIFGILLPGNVITGAGLVTSKMRFVYEVFDALTIRSFYSLPVNKLDSNLIGFFLINPLAHFSIATVLYIIFKNSPQYLKNLLIICLALAYLIIVNIIFNSDPLRVISLTH